MSVLAFLIIGGVKAKVAKAFAELINKLTYMSSQLSLTDLFDAVLDMSGYRAMLEAAGEEEKDRLDNLDEFKSSIQEYINNNENPTLIGFLEENALVADVDRYDDSADAVVLMTIHSAKGLEFPIVILPGFEDGIFPGMQTMVGSDEDMEEERRLAYVALTRAKEQIYILHTKSRLLYGQTQYNPLSRFVKEIPDEYIIEEDKTGGSFFTPSARQGRTFGLNDEASIAYRGGSDYRGGNAVTRKPYTTTPSTTTKPYFNKGGSQAAVGGGFGGPARPITTPASEKTIFAPGDRVRHMTFGDGEILSARSMGSDTLYEVMFEKVGTKKLMATYAKLKKI